MKINLDTFKYQFTRNQATNEEIHENILSWLQDDYNISPSTIDEYILKYVNRPNPKKEMKTEIINLALINKEQKEWSYVNILDTKSQTFLCCTSS